MMLLNKTLCVCRALTRPRSGSIRTGNLPSSPPLSARPRFTSPGYARTWCSLVWAQGLCGVLRTVRLWGLYLLAAGARRFPKALNAAANTYLAEVRFSRRAVGKMVASQLLRTAEVRCLPGTLSLGAVIVPAGPKSTTVTLDSPSHLRRV